MIGPRCKLCGREDCYREITPYSRRVIDFFPYREDDVLIPRFQCKKIQRTFSLLPVQLAPYHRYTVASMAFALLIAHVAARDEGIGLFSVAEKHLDGDSRVNGYLLSCWLGFMTCGFRRAHSWLLSRCDLRGIRSGGTWVEVLAEFDAYVSLVMPRGPPERRARLAHIAGRYCRSSGCFLFGVPSQERRE